jgi:hypothetical protein
MKLRIWTALLLFGMAQSGWGQTSGRSRLGSEGTIAPEPFTNSYTVLGATAQQERLVRAQMGAMQPEVLPLRIIFVPHWKYIDATRIFHLRVPSGYTSTMFTHLPSRTVFIDSDRYVSDDFLGYRLAHELGHLASNSVSESDAERAAHRFRKRLKDAR